MLSELAQVSVLVEWERPTWRVSWQDVPSREALMRRASALGEYRLGHGDIAEMGALLARAVPSSRRP